ncbi:conserved hypothetical protein [Cellulomonas flavigena DSM 20109]|uniref:Lipoprotein n=1 Tax=Cellulomonas flavigena (strain ATCC 482 / DSM 20109 / BCRC 11376 / JCM 18109 / NBRC 3775 / NCIMB 8073 / NRS 134) TaxID=446466 RepID=D5UK28_CELFN|nr:hypothetical protein [Cellulomonas flavigena]ADG73770.1 conserved hypothetical protein [Cellulomonas flavigena DSM 20109]
MTARRTTPRRTRTTALAAAVALAGGALLLACAPTPPGHGPARIADSLAELLEAELALDDLSDLERDVLQRAVDTGRIEQADYDEAMARYLRCMADAGFEVDARQLLNGLYQLTHERPDGADDPGYTLEYLETGDACATGTTRRIEAFFTLQQANPDLLADPYEVAVRCLTAARLVDGRLTARRLERLVDRGLAGVPFDVMSLEAQTCFHGAGLAVAVGAPASPAS